MSELPAVFLERLQKILPPELFLDVLKSFSQEKILSARINPLKAKSEDVFDILNRNHIIFKKVSWNPDAIILENVSREELAATKLLEKGYLFIQNLSSMLPVLALNPRPGETVLDMCAAPGAKTSQMAAHMQNSGSILAVEAIRDRFFRLKSVLSALGATNTALKCTDARRLRLPGTFFDKILVDVPCSCEGRFSTFDRKTYAYWSLRKIKEMVQKQKGLLLSASRFLKPGGTLIYSTCTFAPEENEGVISWLLKKTGGQLSVIPITLEGVLTYPAIEEWNKKKYDKKVQGALRVLPTETMEGFFMAKLAKH